MCAVNLTGRVFLCLRPTCPSSWLCCVRCSVCVSGLSPSVSPGLSSGSVWRDSSPWQPGSAGSLGLTLENKKQDGEFKKGELKTPPLRLYGGSACSRISVCSIKWRDMSFCLSGQLLALNMPGLLINITAVNMFTGNPSRPAGFVPPYIMFTVANMAL